MATQPVSAATESQGALARVWDKVKTRARQWVIYLALLVLVIGFSFASPQFLSVANFVNILRQTAVVCVVGFAMTFVLTAGEIDLSIGAVMALASLVASLILLDHGHWLVASLAALAVGALFGLFNGVLATKARIPSFLVTLGTMGIARGTALSVTGTLTVVFVNDRFAKIWGAGDIGPVPTMVAWTGVVFVLSYLLYNHTIFGRYVQATGGNRIAASFSGVATGRIKLLTLVMSGTAAAFGGLIMTARLYSGRPYIGQGLEMDVIAAVILGGTSLFGGKGTMIGTLVGALIIGVINNGLLLVGMGTNVQMIVKGAIVIAAVFFAEKAY